MPLEAIKEFSGTIVVVLMAIFAAAWRSVSMILKLRRDIDDAHTRINNLDRKTEQGQKQLREDIYNLGEKLEASHSKIFDKIDETRRELNSK
jgi:hypothetical protein